jgi:hypothetical protein
MVAASSVLMPGRYLPVLGSASRERYPAAGGGDVRLFTEGEKPAEIDTQRGVRFRPGAAAERHHQPMMFTGIAQRKIWLLQVTCQSEKDCCAGAAHQGAGSTQKRRE